MNVLQNLYEHHKIVTYPRTDSRYLTPDIASTMPERLKAVSSMYGGETRSILHKQKGKVLAKFVYNESKVSDHHALIPTEQPVFMSDLSDDERRLFDLVVRRFLALFYPQYQYRSIHAELDINGESFVLNVSEQTDPGFKQLSAPSDAPHPQAKLRLTQAQQLQVRRIRVEDKMTEPPARFQKPIS
ncbi:DNA topoisomerase III [Sporolactobacillus inulinus]|uniref:DNA topoisomerase III n=1 Tax=Sporolactobacillus inulinus TaxID=2078 RepID=A0A4Y1ZET2_9BACL|nr:DNA topoisomerase III [Sporolactobacillus inulinus]